MLNFPRNSCSFQRKIDNRDVLFEPAGDYVNLLLNIGSRKALFFAFAAAHKRQFSSVGPSIFTLKCVNIQIVKILRSPKV
ncbi:hypothetical protein P3S68_024726 [Capsicum galapagoense]